MKGVFTTKRETAYDDRIEERYHFPSRYSAAARRTLGDWIIYHESKRAGGRMAYIGAARVVAIEDHPQGDGHYARMADFVEFPAPVPLRNDAGFYESLLNTLPNPSRIGAALQGASIRPIADADFTAIVLSGLHNVYEAEHWRRLDVDAGVLPDRRDMERVLTSRIVRDANFRDGVTRAYDETCAFTGIRIINGGGRAEVQAAHIWPVEAGGPDIIRNGIALSGTVHWMFDRHLITLTDGYEMLISHNKVPVEWRSMFQRQQQRILLPKDSRHWPHPEYLRRHRERLVA
jgi:putative restriction endonuclease